MYGGVYMPEANLLVTFEPSHESSSKAEIENLLKEVKESAKILAIGEGLAQVSVKDAKKALSSLLKIAKKNSEKFSYTYNWWPVDKWCKAEIKDMQKVIAELEKGIKKDDKWKLDLAIKQTTKTYPKNVIIQLTEVIDKPNVDLDSPDKIIKVEIVKEKAALSLLTKDEVLSVQKLK